MVHKSVVQWINNTYPKPKVDPDWLNACYAWVLDEFKLDTESQMEQIQKEIESQLLESDLSDSTVGNTGLHSNTLALKEYRLRGGPVLVEVTAITEIGHSAFNIQNVRQTRLEKVDLNGLAAEDPDAEQESVPKYPRTMLRLELSDGAVNFPAIEYRPLPSLLMGETPLGYKVTLATSIVLKEGLLFRRGIAFLEADKVILKGHKTDERVSKQDADFLSGLRKRLGNSQAEDAASSTQVTTNMQVPNNAVSSVGAAAAAGDVYSPRKRRNIDTGPSSTQLSGSTIVSSPYFLSNASTTFLDSSSERADPITNQLSRLLSPSRGGEDISYDWEPEGPPTSDSGSSGNNNEPRHKQLSKLPDSAHTRGNSDIDYDLDDDANIDDAFLEEIARMEEVAFANDQPLVHAEIQGGFASDGVIIIDDQEEDKENHPYFDSRPVRSQTRNLQISTDVIDISDMY